jgi:copper transport protein
MEGRENVSRARIGVRLMVGGAAMVTALALGAAPASAHAQLLSTEPASNEVLDAPPDQVVLHFSEAVQPPGDAIQVFAASGDEVDVGDVTSPAGGADVAVTLPALDDGAYVVTWRVTSADSHPIRGGFTFRVGAAGSNAEAEALMEQLVSGAGGDTTVGFIYGAARFVAFVGMVLLVGGAAFVLLLWPAGARDARARRLLAAGWLATLAATVLAFGLQGAYAAGKPLSSAVDNSMISDVVATRAGRVWLVRLLVLAVVLVAHQWLLPSAADGTAPGWAGLRARWAARGRRSLSVGANGEQPDGAGDPPSGAGGRSPRAALLAAGGLGLALLATISLAGHAGTGDLVALALPTDLVHLAGVSLWLGGLAMLLAVVLRGRWPSTESDLRAVVTGFSTLALWAVSVIVLSGTIQGVRQVQGFSAPTSTTYGRLLIVKVLLVALLVAVAAVSRDWVRRRWRRADGPSGSAGPEGGAEVSELVTSPFPGASPVIAGLSPQPEGQSAPTRDPAGTSGLATASRPRGLPLSSLRRSVGIEAALAVVVLAVTALLVNTVPAVDEYAPTFTAELHGEALLVAVEVDPAKAGLTDITIETRSHLGQPQAVEEVTASLRLPSRDIGPIPLALEPDGSAPGRYVARDTDIPLSGLWQLQVTARLSEFEQNEVETDVLIR